MTFDLTHDRRRLLLVGLMAAGSSALALPAFAQSAPAASMPGEPPMGDAEKTHAMKTMMVGSLSLATSRVALKKAHHPMVKQFSQFETAEQETIADILKSMMMDPMQAEGALHPPTDAEVQAQLDAKGKDMVMKLADMKSGRAFDSMYVQAQTDGHQQLLGIQEDYLKVGKNREHLSVAKLARGQIKEHLTLLADISGMMKG